MGNACGSCVIVNNIRLPFIMIITQVSEMSFEVLEQLEAKIQTAVDTIALLQMEVEELKERNEQLAVEAGELKEGRVELEQQTQTLRQEQQAWQERIRSLLGKMDDVE